MGIERVIVIERDAALRQLLVETLLDKHVNVLALESEEAAYGPLRGQLYDLMICDSSLDFLAQVKKAYPEMLILFVAPGSAVDNIIEAVHAGAFHCLLKPFDAKKINALWEKAEEQATLLQENRYLRQALGKESPRRIDEIIAESAVMKRIWQDVALMARSQASIFISGESGTGKEIISQAIHHQSPRVNNPFIKVNCAAIPETLIESEFFGHEKGAFTGAIAKRLGRFELAHGGTLLLDEISEIPMNVQAKLLRVIQEQEFERVGGTRPIKVDVRLISTSNKDMKDAIAKKQFREDLYYRLNVVPLKLPPLRHRKEDIVPLAEYFLERLCAENNKSRKTLTPEAKKKLVDYYWPGNIRELANLIERTVVMHHLDKIRGEDFHLDASSAFPTLALGTTLDEMEKRLILETLRSQKENRTKTAALLGISVRTLHNKLNNYKAPV